MNQDNGGIIGKLNTPTTTVASGVWTLQDQFEAQTSSIWPLAFPQTTFTNSVRMDGDQSDDSLSRSISGVSTTKFSLSFWTKYAAPQGIGSEGPILFSSENNSGDYIIFQLNTSNQIDFSFQGTQNRRITNRVFRDPSAFYHFLVVIDTTESTASDRLKIYVNGSQETSFATSTTNVSQSANISPIDETLNYSIGRYNGQSSDFCYDGYFSEFIAVYGQALTPSSFGAFNPVTNIWEPIAYAGTYGSNGFKLNFSDSSNLGDDTSGNGNDFTVNNLTSIDQSTDTPSNNFATMNPLTIPSGASLTLVDGNLALNGDSTDAGAKSTFGVSSGKWYWEIKANKGSSASDRHLVATDIVRQITSATDPNSQGIWGIQSRSGSGATLNSYTNGTFSNGNSGTTGYDDNTIISVALDMDNGKLYFAKNGTYTDLSGNTGDPANGTNPTFTGLPTDGTVLLPYVENRTASGTPSSSLNFGSPFYTISSGNADANGHGNFEYAVPSGYFALCTKNLAEFG